MASNKILKEAYLALNGERIKYEGDTMTHILLEH